MEVPIGKDFDDVKILNFEEADAPTAAQLEEEAKMMEEARQLSIQLEQQRQETVEMGD